jgi:hypothetical protein
MMPNPAEKCGFISAMNLHIAILFAMGAREAE